MKQFTIQKKNNCTFCWVLSFFIIINGCSFEKPVTVFPADGISIENNTPTLSWTPVNCDFYVVSIDDLIFDTINAQQNFMVPFPLSFGEHWWEVVAHKGKISMKSETALFNVNDRPLNPLPEDALLLRYNWFVQSSLVLDANGQQLSSGMFDFSDWYATSVPATVLSTLVRNGVYPNPYVDLNNMKIPDSNDEYNATYDLLKYSHIEGLNPWHDPYWYCTEFDLSEFYEGKEVWLNFSEINYRAEVWVNGSLVADTATMVGMERSFKFNISAMLLQNEMNHVAVAIYPVDVPGKPDIEPLTTLGDPGVNMGDGMISRNYTKWDALGWDWQPAIRDRNMGITEDVFLSTTNKVEIQNTYIGCNLPLPDTTFANISISAELINHSKTTQKGKIRTTITNDNCIVSFEKNFNFENAASLLFRFNSENTPELRLENPKLWWPSGYGRANLYHFKMEVLVSNEVVGSYETSFGIRQVETYIGLNERVIKINGEKIYIKGGNWVLDMMLNWNASRYDDEITLSKNAGQNLLRVWGPTGVPPRAFYEAADKHGMLLWQDFLNDYWGTFRNSEGFTPEDNLYKAATIEIVKKFRNHPSLIMWCGGNEGVNPREELIMGEILPNYDYLDSRFYLRASDNDGLHGGGPYHTISPNDFFVHPKLNGFSSEIGPSGVPVLESAQKFMPRLGNDYLAECFPLDAVWAYHDANDRKGSDPRRFSSYDMLLRKFYGSPTPSNSNGVSDYFSKAQLLNYDVYRAAIEAINAQLWENSSGILFWKTNSSWPSMVWQLYDWYQQAHAGYYGAMKASELIHVQMNRNNNQVGVLNATPFKIENAKIEVTLFNAQTDTLWHREQKMNLPANCFSPSNNMAPITGELCFLKLKLSDSTGKLISDNFYWLGTDNDFTGLNTLSPSVIEGSVERSDINENTFFDIKLKNTGNKLAFMLACKLVDERTGVELLPSLWSNNYICLLPGESENLRVFVNSKQLTGSQAIEIKAHNMPAISIKVDL
ncbi:MAG TPA: hypothetical protein VJY41_07110 [Prolixibacteraceae bacterium]|nr:hypothetical protein [Prolixibacteraceae bacterium]